MEYAITVILGLHLVVSVIAFIVNTINQEKWIKLQEDRIRSIENIYGIIITPPEYPDSDSDDEEEEIEEEKRTESSALRVTRINHSNHNTPTNYMEMNTQREKGE